jgi:hypothetical protein
MDECIRQLEDVNIDYMTTSLDIDWNLQYSMDDELEATQDYVFDYPSEIEKDDDWILSEYALDDDDLESLDSEGEPVCERDYGQTRDYKNLVTKLRIADIDACANKIFELENKRKTIDAKVFGVSGESIKLEKVALKDAGALKFY